MKTGVLETLVGIFIIIGIFCVGYLTIKLGKMELFGSDNYFLTARFQSVSGLKEGARIEIAGVPVGEVDEIALDREKQVALVRFKIKKNITLTDDVIASVKTSGLIGDKYIMFSPGGSDLLLEDGDIIEETESVLDIEALISKFAFGGV